MAKPKPPVVAADPPPAFVLPDRVALPAVATPVPPVEQTSAVAAVTPAPAQAPAPHADFQLLLTLASVAVGLAALAALFALLSWRRGAASDGLGQQVTRLADEMQRTDRTIRDETAAMRREADERGVSLRGELVSQVAALGAALNTGLEGTRGGVETRMDAFAKAQGDASELLRMAVGKSVTGFGEGLKQDFTIFQSATREQLAVVEQRIAALTEANEARQQALREAVEKQLEALRLGNDAKLEQMRATVDEKLQGTLEKRLGESFALVSERLENVQRGLGEMQSLALGVGDLKRVLTNVKTRGGWGEMQLGALLSSLLAAEQFAEQVAVTGGANRVDFAIRLPGGEGGLPIWLPIDAKFPVEDYERLLGAQELGDAVGIEAAGKAIEQAIRIQAKSISEKYLSPPATTDFAILYLPGEGLFAEVIRRAGLVDELQRKHRVAVAGPTTLAALLNSLQMGFRTLAIQQRSSEVWRVLGEAKAEFEKYGQVWDKLKKQLETAQNTVDEAGKRTKAVSRKLRDVETIDVPTPPLLLDDGED
jgi:DNA recombination protein RmuC